MHPLEHGLSMCILRSLWVAPQAVCLGSLGDRAAPRHSAQWHSAETTLCTMTLDTIVNKSRHYAGWLLCRKSCVLNVVMLSVIALDIVSRCGYIVVITRLCGPICLWQVSNSAFIIKPRQRVFMKVTGSNQEPMPNLSWYLQHPIRVLSFSST